MTNEQNIIRMQWWGEYVLRYIRVHLFNLNHHYNSIICFLLLSRTKYGCIKIPITQSSTKWIIYFPRFFWSSPSSHADKQSVYIWIANIVPIVSHGFHTEILPDEWYFLKVTFILNLTIAMVILKDLLILNIFVFIVFKYISFKQV